MNQPGRSGRPFASYREAVRFLEGTVNYEKKPSVKYVDRNFNLGRMRALLGALGEPQQKLRIIHVAGTKGKGTTAALIASCLRAAGYRVGLHTSPHLVSVRERVRVDGEPIRREEFRRLLSAQRPHLESARRSGRGQGPTYFEITVALALQHFAAREVDWSVLEVGLGGRLDSTNVVRPACCVVTPIGFDHTDKLGETIEQIAGEKAGIFKEGVPVVWAAQRYAGAADVLRERARQLGCPAWEVGREVRIGGTRPLASPPDLLEAPVGWSFELGTPGRTHRALFCPLLGRHQVENCATAVGTLEMLRSRGELEIGTGPIARGIARCRWPARVELLRRRPTVVLDAAHTAESVEALLEALCTHFPDRPVRMVFGCSADKDYRRMLELLSPRCAELVLTRCSSPRAAEPADLVEAARGVGPRESRAITPPPEALEHLLGHAAQSDVVCVTGSFYVAGEILQLWGRGERAG